MHGWSVIYGVEISAMYTYLYALNVRWSVTVLQAKELGWRPGKESIVTMTSSCRQTCQLWRIFHESHEIVLPLTVSLLRPWNSWKLSIVNSGRWLAMNMGWGQCSNGLGTRPYNFLSCAYNYIRARADWTHQNCQRSWTWDWTGDHRVMAEASTEILVDEDGTHVSNCCVKICNVLQ